MKFDLVIVGGGMVGATLGVCLQASGLKIAVVDASPLDAGADARLIALNYLSFALFKNLGLEDQLSPHAAPIEQIHVSCKGHFGSTRLRAQDLEMPALGYVIPAKYITQAVNSALSGITLLRPAELKDLQIQNDAVFLNLDIASRQETLETNMVIGADGTHSTVRKLLKMPISETHYSQSALVAEVFLKDGHQNTAYERFVCQGAIAILPLGTNTGALIWTDENKVIKELRALDDKLFLEKLSTTFGYRLGRFTGIGQRFTYPLQRLHTKTPSESRVLLMGSAAHTVHPVAAQGLNLALYEIALMADYVQQHASLRGFELPTQYFRENLSHYLTHLFASTFPGVGLARSIGLLGLDNLSFLKKLFLKTSLGQSADLPTLFTS